MLNENSSVIASTALGPVRNEDDATAKFINKQVILDSDAFYVYDVETGTETGSTSDNSGVDSTAGSSEAGTETQLN